MFDVTIKEKQGSMNSELFEVMASSGDLNPTRLAEVIGEVVTLKGYAICDIKTPDKEFNVIYIDTEELGIISSGSDIFKESVQKYYGKVNQVRISEVKTKKGKTYKVTPILGNNTTNQEETNQEHTNDELPF